MFSSEGMLARGCGAAAEKEMLLPRTAVMAVRTCILSDAVGLWMYDTRSSVQMRDGTVSDAAVQIRVLDGVSLPSRVPRQHVLLYTWLARNFPWQLRHRTGRRGRKLDRHKGLLVHARWQHGLRVGWQQPIGSRPLDSHGFPVGAADVQLRLIRQTRPSPC